MKDNTEDYQKSCDMWVDYQKNLITQLKQNIENSTQMINIHTEALNLANKQLEHETNFLDTFLSQKQ